MWNMVNVIEGPNMRCLENKCPHKDACSIFCDVSGVVVGIEKIGGAYCVRDDSKQIMAVDKIL